MNPFRRSKTFPVVAIGASAGGLKAFEELLNALPKQPGMAVVLVPHLAPQYKSHLTEILARNSKLSVAEVKSGDKVAPDRIYVLPPNRAMQIRKGVLRLTSAASTSGRRAPIDGFFRSLAVDQGARSVGVLLSGEGSDGTEGLRAIKENGGTTFAQDGKTAAHMSMPHSAVLSGCVDFILSPAEIGNRLASLRQAARPAPRRKEPKPAAGGGDSIVKILKLLRTTRGVEFELYKRSTLRRRILRRMALNRVQEPERYLRALKSDPQELELLYRDVLISVTAFFREQDSFKALKTVVYPRIVKNRSPGAPIRIWVPGCSTGEEAYSHAINLVEFLGTRVLSTPFQIFATDVNPAVIAKARIGLYSKKLKAELSPERLRRFFVETEEGYRIDPAIREHCIFAAKNLLQDPPFTNLDLISCRNLLIYLEPTLQEKALGIFQYALKPRGILMLGRSENIGDFSGRFSPLDVKRKVFSESTSASRARLDFVPPPRFLQTESAFKEPERSQGRNEPGTDAFDLRGAMDCILPLRYIPNGVIVNEQLEILRFLGDTVAYLRPAPGKPSMNLRRMASGELLMELRAAIHVAKKSACAVRKEVAAGGTGGRRTAIEVLPIKASHLHKEYFLVLFEDVARVEPGKPRAAETRRGKDSRRVIELKADLAVSGEHLKSIIEEQETTNAKLKASNEELLSSNEELQSVNEEFETAKEELQSANEELISSNEEVVHANEVLERANGDLSNLLANINIPILLLGPDLTVQRFTPPAQEVLELSAGVIGRSVADIRMPLRIPQLKQRLLNVISTGRAQALEVQDKRGRWFQLLLRPYRSDPSKAAKSRAEGAVLALIDIHDRKLSERTVVRLATLVRDSNDAVIIRDLRHRIVAWNRGAHSMYGYSEAEVLGMNVLRLIPEGKRAEKSAWLKELLAKGEAPPSETQRRAKDGRILDVLLTATVLRDEQGRPMELATTEHDITEQKRADREMRSLHARVVSAQETERLRIARELHDGIGQILSGVKFRLEALPGKFEDLPEKAEQEISRASGVIDRAISETRRVSRDLMPTELQDLGLQPALRTLCRDFHDLLGIPVTLKCAGLPETIDPRQAMALFRICQEALHNVAKHARATRAVLSLARKGSEFELTVRDDGRGFTSKHRLRRAKLGGVGLANMRERAELIGGALDIRSNAGKGTTLRVRVPLGRGGEPAP